jgi:hypothetical protein
MHTGPPFLNKRRKKSRASGFDVFEFASEISILLEDSHLSSVRTADQIFLTEDALINISSTIDPSDFSHGTPVGDHGYREGMPPDRAEPGKESGNGWGRLANQFSMHFSSPFRKTLRSGEFQTSLGNRANLGPIVLEMNANQGTGDGPENLPDSIFLRMVELGIFNQYDHGRNIEAGKGFTSTSLRVGTPNCEIHSEYYGPTFMRGNDGEYPEPLLTEANDGSYSPAFESSIPLNEVIPISVSGSSATGFRSQVSSQSTLPDSPRGVRESFTQSESDHVGMPVCNAWVTKSAFSNDSAGCLPVGREGRTVELSDLSQSKATLGSLSKLRESEVGRTATQGGAGRDSVTTQNLSGTHEFDT